MASRCLTLAGLLRDLEIVERVAPRDVVRIHVMVASAKERESVARYRLLCAARPHITFELAFVTPELPSATIASSARVRLSLPVTD